MSFRSQFKAAGLGTAMTEQGLTTPCVNSHAYYAREKNFQFCPKCGERLVLLHHCDSCNRDFYSAGALWVHNHGHPATCPKCHQPNRVYKCPKGMAFQGGGHRGGFQAHQCKRCDVFFSWNYTTHKAMMLSMNVKKSTPLSGVKRDGTRDETSQKTI